MIKLRSYAKVNLYLEVGPRQSDGYHPIDSVMQSVDLADEVTVDWGTDAGSAGDVDMDRRRLDLREERTSAGPAIKMECNRPDVPVGEANIAARAARAFFEAISYSSDRPGAVTIRLKKRIPVAAGLAGGSGNAAAVLLALNEILKTGLSLPELQKIGMTTGADIPFCIQGGTARVRGLGEIVEPIPAGSQTLLPLPAHIILVKPPVFVSTKEAYDALDKAGAVQKELGSQTALPSKCFNRFESVIAARHPVIGEIKTALQKAGAGEAVMSGSGPTVFGFFADEETALAALEKIRVSYPESFLAQPIDRGVQIL